MNFKKFWFILRTTVLFTKSSDVPVTLETKNRGKKNRDFETKGVDLCPPRGTLQEWEGNGN